MKFLIIKKSLPLFISAVCLVGVWLGVFCDGVRRANATVMPTVVIDAGHGGIDAGVRGIITGVKESDLNLSISQKLRGLFVNAGFNCVMTRNTQAGLYGAYSKGFKMRDMKKRKKIIEDSCANVVISIHQNFCPIPSRRGGQVFFNSENASGKSFADCVQLSLNAMEQCAKKSDALAGDYYMLKCTVAPSIIVECGFLSNAQDEELLISDDYQKDLACAIFAGVLTFFNRQ